MRILLDTSYLYRLMTQPARLSDAERLILTNQTLQLYVSAVSIWEMRLKFQSFERSGKRKSPFDPNLVLSLLEDQDIIFLPITPSHAARPLETPVLHKDPFDEMLLVQAQEEGLKLLTVDRQITGHPLAIRA